MGKEESGKENAAKRENIFVDIFWKKHSMLNQLYFVPAWESYLASNSVRNLGVILHNNLSGSSHTNTKMM